MLHAACRALSGLRNVYQALQLRDPETHSGISRDSLKQARLQNPIKGLSASCRQIMTGNGDGLGAGWVLAGRA